MKTALVSLTMEVTKHSYATLFIMIVNNMLTRALEMELKKIYPLKTIVIRFFRQEKLTEASMDVDKTALEELNSSLNRESSINRRKLKPRRPKEENSEGSQIAEEQQAVEEQ